MMKYLNFLFLSFFILINTESFGQPKYQNIEVFAKVWGFLKYHHPAVANGTIDWDSVFIAHINKVRYAKDVAGFNDEIAAMITAAGPVKILSPAKLPDDVFTANHDLKWLNTSTLLSNENKQKLQFIYANRNQGACRFIKANNASDFSGEKAYGNMGFPTSGYRLLFLSRFWNVINYFAPYKYIIGEDWNNVLTRFIPSVINSKDSLTYYKTLMKLAVSLHDGHSQFTISDDEAPVNDLVFGKYAAPVYVDIIDGKVIVRSVANDTLLGKINIRQGDEVIGIDDKPVLQQINERKVYISASNNTRMYNLLGWILFDTHATTEKLKIERGNDVFTVNVKCILASKRSWGDLCNYTGNNTGYKTVGKSIAYIYAAQIWHGNLDTIIKLIKSKKAVIFDVRNYPNGNDFYNIFHMFLPEPAMIDSSLHMMPDNPGYFKWQPTPMMGDVNNAAYKGKVIILVDERSQSQGEYSAMALQTIPNSITIGSQTAGADGAVSVVPMGGKLALSYSGYGEFYTDKTPTQQRGVKIDIYAKKTVESMMKGEDVVVEKALQYLKEHGID